MKTQLATMIAAGAALAAIGLAAPASAQDGNPDGCIETFDPGRNYFPERITLEHARNFEVDYHDSYKVVTVLQPYPGGDPEHYVLVQCGAPAPALAGDLADAPQITVPIRSMFTGSSTQNPLTLALGKLAALTGVGSAAFSYSQEIRDRVAAGDAVEYAGSGTADVELVIDRDPDVLFTGGTENAEYATLRAAGIPVVAYTEYLEPSVLGIAEWLKFMAVFFNEEALAEELFDGIEERYAAAAALVAGIPEADRPLVIAGAGYSGTFYAPGGQTSVAQNIAAAGGRYIYADDTTRGGIPLADIEPILDRGADAEFWINGLTSWRSLADVAADEPRLAALPAAASGNVWMYDKMTSEGGAVAYFEQGVIEPDVILGDLIQIFHPDLLPDRELVYYRNIRLN